ncbi:MAG: prolyl aminopeptidase [Pseudomonadota bacterium]
MMDLFPALTPYSSGFLSVDDTHNLYWEQSGNPEGVPILLLHGGPGAGATPTHRRFFDPNHYRIIIFDQRGAGRSHPLGSIENNTTQHLVDDIERLREHLRVERWHLFGGSWGSTLALNYAVQFPEKCISMILRGIFLCEQREIDWFMDGMHKVFPEAWEQFAEFLPEDERDNLLDNYYKYLTGDDEKKQMDAAICWSLYEGACSSLLPNYETITTEEQKEQALALARIEAHFFKNEAVDAEKGILSKIDTLKTIPTTIIQGRYDMICPIQTAHELHLRWPEADYIVVPDAGHSALDPALRSRLIEATENAKTLRI